MKNEPSTDNVELRDPEFVDRCYLVPRDVFKEAVAIRGAQFHTFKWAHPLMHYVYQVADRQGVDILAMENPVQPDLFESTASYAFDDHNETPPTVDQTLQERGTRYGDFAHHASICQELLTAMRMTTGWPKLAPVQAQALTVIADKIARVLSGDPDYVDNWHDLQGYARLVENWLNSGKKSCL